MKAVLSLPLLATAASISAFTIEFVNNCDYSKILASVIFSLIFAAEFVSTAVWPAIGKAPNGVPDTSVAYGVELEAGSSTSFTIGDTETVRVFLSSTQAIEHQLTHF